MNIDQTEIDALVANPSETRSVETKAWIDPRTPEGKVTLLKALLALRNFNGGRLVIGFNDKNLQPLGPDPGDVLAAYRSDDIQSLVSKHSSETFDVAVCFGHREAQIYPVIVVDSGVRSPVAVKAPVTDQSGNQRLKAGSVFFRTLHSNGTVSSAEVQPGDWAELIEICMDNREADIGRFVRRHLAGLENIDKIADALGLLRPENSELVSLEARTGQWLTEGANRAQMAFNQWPSRPYPGHRPDIAPLWDKGAWEVALVIDPPPEHLIADETFYSKVASNVPSFASWPIWVGTRNSANPSNRHMQVNDGWEAFLVSFPPQGLWDHVEFQRWEPSGRFYLRRLLDDDASARIRGAIAGLMLDLGRVASRVGEAIIAGLSIAKGLGCPADKTHLGFRFRWTGLSGRIASFWASGLSYAPDVKKCLDHAAVTFVSVPLSTAHSAVTPFVDKATRPVFAKFDGFSMPENLLEHCVRLLLDHKA